MGSSRDKGYSTDPAFVKHNPIAPRKLFAAIFILVITIVFPILYISCKKNLMELITEYKKEKGHL